MPAKVQTALEKSLSALEAAAADFEALPQETDTQAALDRLRHSLQEADTLWTSIIRENGAAIERKFYEQNAVFYEGGEAECRRFLNHQKLPAWERNSHALWQGIASNLTRNNAARIIANFVTFVRAHSTAFYIILPQVK